jgi:hypothetical protein
MDFSRSRGDGHGVSSRIESIRKAVEETEKCRATHLHSVQVIRHKDELVCGGVVEVFDLHGHPKSKRAYAWQRKANGRDDVQYTVVLGIGPVDSANAAVQAAIMGEDKRHGE